MLNYSRDKSEGAYRSGEGEKSLVYDLGSELQLGWSEKRRANIMNGIHKKKQKT